MTTHAAKFAALLTEAVFRIKGLTSRPIEVIQDELGYAIGKKGGASIERWRQGYVPANLSDLEALARELAKQIDFNSAWFEEFLSYGGHPQPERLCNELFPREEEPQPLATIIYLKPTVEVRRKNSTRLILADFGMPLYRDDIIYTHIGAMAHIICNNGLLFEVIEERNLTVDCQSKTNDERILGNWQAVIGERLLQFSRLPIPAEANLTGLAEAEAAIQNMVLDENGRAYLLAQLYRRRGLWEAAADQLAWLTKTKGIISAYLSQQLGDLYFAADLFTQAEENYRRALDAAQASSDESAQAAARVGLNRVTYVREVEQQAFLEYVHSLAKEIILTMAPDLIDEFQEIVDIFFERVVELGGQFRLGSSRAPALGFGSGEIGIPLQILAATYMATQSLTDELSAQEIETYLETGNLHKKLQQQAENAARQAARLNRRQARDFAERYTLLVERNPAILQELTKNRASSSKKP